MADPDFKAMTRALVTIGQDDGDPYYTVRVSGAYLEAYYRDEDAAKCAGTIRTTIETALREAYALGLERAGASCLTETCIGSPSGDGRPCRCDDCAALRRAHNRIRSLAAEARSGDARG